MTDQINLDLIDQLLKDYKSPEDVLGENGLLKQLTKAVLERAMQAELSHHLGYEKHSLQGNNSGNSRNGKFKKTLKGDFGNLPIDVPRDRNATFEPKIVPKGETRFAGEQELERFAEKWDEKFPSIVPMWRRDWERVAVFFAYPEEIRRVIYTTNAIECVNMGLRKIIKNRGSFPNDEER
jgi:transposase-like protein